MKNILILLCVLLAGCGRVETWRTLPTTPEERQACELMIEELCRAANSPANKDPEDLIDEARRTAFETLCRPTKWYWNRSENQFEPLETLGR